MARLPALVAAFSLQAGLALAQSPGAYVVEGRNPDGSGYSGSVSVERTGDTYRIVWVIAGERFTGTAIGGEDGLAITFRSGNRTGIALTGREGDRYGSVWAFAGERVIGTEVWRRR